MHDEEGEWLAMLREENAGCALVATIFLGCAVVLLTWIVTGWLPAALLVVGGAFGWTIAKLDGKGGAH